MRELDYELLDCGNGQKQERFGNNVIIRPESRAVWSPQSATWHADAFCARDEKNTYVWTKNNSFAEPWQISYGSLRFELRMSKSNNIGIFPEQVENWQWLSNIIKNAKKRPKVLNLFAYTGGATLALAKAGADVCHVDASKSTVRWASQNLLLSGLSDKSVRWIVDDAMQFLRREIKRGVVYDGIILDPPPLGHGAAGVFVFKKHVLELLSLCKQVLVQKPLFLLFNCYALNYTPKMARDLVVIAFPFTNLECGELQIREKMRQRALSCSVYVRFANVQLDG